MKQLFLLPLALSLVCTAWAQVTPPEGDCLGLDPNEIRYPEDAQLKEEIRVKNAFYTDLLRNERTPEAIGRVSWLLKNAPALTPSLYINGAKVYQAVGDNTEDKAEKLTYYDSAIYCYDLRAYYYCDEEGDLLNRKAYLSFRFFYREPSRHQQLYDQFWEAYKKLENNFYTPSAEYFMQLAAWRLKAKKIEVDDLIEVYEALTGVVAAKVVAGKVSEENGSKLQNKLDGLLVGAIGEGGIDNDFMEEFFCSKLAENPGNLDQAKKIVSFSLGVKTTDHDCYLEAANTVFDQEPTLSMARLIADKHRANGDRDMALDWYQKTLELMDDPLEKSELLYVMAAMQMKANRFSSARSLALEGIKEDPTNTKHHSLIGDMYLQSYETCKNGENKVHDRAIYIAAYNWYAKAGDAARMARAKEQFPSKDEIFTYNMTVGGNYTIGCWIGETVAIMSRD